MQDGGTECCIRSKGAATLLCLLELFSLSEILDCVRIINPVVIARLAQGVPGINAERTAKCRAVGIDFRVTTLIADNGEVFWT